MTLYLFRHSTTVWTPEHRYLGRTDLPLSAEGAAALTARPEQPKEVFVSRLRRTQQTAAILFPKAKQIVVPAFDEMDFGAFEGRNYRDLEHDAAYRAWVDAGCRPACPGGESMDAFCSRVGAAFESIMDRACEENGEDLTIVAHGGTLMAILSRFARPERDYFAWSTPAGGGHLLTADPADWKTRRKITWRKDLPT